MKLAPYVIGAGNYENPQADSGALTSCRMTYEFDLIVGKECQRGHWIFVKRGYGSMPS